MPLFFCYLFSITIFKYSFLANGLTIRKEYWAAITAVKGGRRESFICRIMPIRLILFVN